MKKYTLLMALMLSSTGCDFAEPLSCDVDEDCAGGGKVCVSNRCVAPLSGPDAENLPDEMRDDGLPDRVIPDGEDMSPDVDAAVDMRLVDPERDAGPEPEDMAVDGSETEPPCVPSEEVCNGVDDDCDGTADNVEGLGEACRAGEGICAADGTWACTPEGRVCDAELGEPAEEVCNGIDDDCDGNADETFDGLGEACTEGVGACAVEGMIVCTDDGVGTQCDAEAGAPGVEFCNDVDDDCDGNIDNVEGLGEPCSEGVGQCAANGARVCGDGGLVCDATPGEPADELCDGNDNDCDGETDEAFEDLGEACDVGQGACLRVGVNVCNVARDGTFCDAEPGEVAVELCGTGIDEDCDGQLDERFPDLGAVCQLGVGECRRGGQFVCTLDGSDLECNATPAPPGEAELCGTGRDDDCDGEIDEGFRIGEPCFGGIGACEAEGAYVCSPNGTEQCEVTPGSPEPEVCDEADNDCDGNTDEGVLSSAEHCGACNTPCAGANATTECVEQVCTLTECAPGFIDANGVANDGCEVEWANVAPFYVDRFANFDGEADGSALRPFVTISAALTFISANPQPGEARRVVVLNPSIETETLEVPALTRIEGEDAPVSVPTSSEGPSVILAGRFAAMRGLRVSVFPGEEEEEGGEACRHFAHRCTDAIVEIAGDFARVEESTINASDLCHTGVWMSCGEQCALHNTTVSNLEGRCGYLFKDLQVPVADQRVEFDPAERVRGVLVGPREGAALPRGVSIREVTITALRGGTGNTIRSNRVHGYTDGIFYGNTGGDVVGLDIAAARDFVLENNQISELTAGLGGLYPSGLVQVTHAGVGGEAVAMALGDASSGRISGNRGQGLNGGPGGDMHASSNAGRGGHAMGIRLSADAINNVVVDNAFESVNPGEGGAVGIRSGNAFPWTDPDEASANGTAFGVYFEDFTRYNAFDLALPNFIECEPVFYRHCDGAQGEEIMAPVAVTRADTTNVGKLVVVECPGVIISDAEIGGIQGAVGVNGPGIDGYPTPGDPGVGIRIHDSPGAIVRRSRVFNIVGGEAGRPIDQPTNRSHGADGVGIWVESSPNVIFEQVLVSGVQGGVGSPAHPARAMCGGVDGRAVGIQLDNSGARFDHVLIQSLSGRDAVGVEVSGQGLHQISHLTVARLDGNSRVHETCLAMEGWSNPLGLVDPPAIPGAAVRVVDVGSIVQISNSLAYEGTGVFTEGPEGTLAISDSLYGDIALEADPVGELAGDELVGGLCSLALAEGSPRIVLADDPGSCAQPQPDPQAVCMIEPGHVGPTWYVDDVRQGSPWGLSGQCPEAVAPAACPE
ncbi:MAG: MopE-related protein [Bradymonadia bacterium]